VLELRNISICGVLLTVAAGLSACGGGDPSEVVARVGSTTITRIMLDHRISAESTGKSSTSPVVGREALAALISSDWVLGEAKSRGVLPSARTVRRWLVDRAGTPFPEGAQELRDFLRASGEQPADAEREAQVEVASAALRRLAINGTHAATDTEAKTYYRHHTMSFTTPERRIAEFTNRKTKAEAEVVRRTVESGGSLPTARQHRFGELTVKVSSSPNRRNQFEKLIYAAPPHVLIGPLRYGADYVLFRVISALSPARTPWGSVRAAIKRRLDDERRREAVARFVRAWRNEWRAKTACARGYVIQKCRQYTGSRVAEDPLALE
jgi:hypothetical protein